MGVLNAIQRQQQQSNAFATAPPFTQRMAETGQLQMGQPLPPQQQSTLAAPVMGHSQPWRMFGDAGGGAMTAAQFPFLQQRVLSMLQQYPQKKPTHTLGSGRG